MIDYHLAHQAVIKRIVLKTSGTGSVADPIIDVGALYDRPRLELPY